MKVFYSEKSENLRNNILIQNIMKYYDNKEIVIIINGKYDYSKQEIGKKNKIFGELFVTEEEFLDKDISADIYILMNTQIFDNLEKITDKLEDKDVVYISRERQQKRKNVYSIEELRFRHSKKWREKVLLKNNEIIEWIKDTLNIAEERIYLECPWFNEDAFNQDFIDRIENAVLRGVDVRIKYGINLSEDSRAAKTIKVIGKLKSIGKHENLHFIEGDSHAKIVYIDNLYLSGSLNFGSNSMKNIDSPEEKANISVYNSIEQLNEIQKSFSIE